MRIVKSNKLVTANTNAPAAKSSVKMSANDKSLKVIKSAIDDLGAIAASCDNIEDKKAIQGAIANMSVVLLEMKGR